jgi:transposase InsO family protein
MAQSQLLKDLNRLNSDNYYEWDPMFTAFITTMELEHVLTDMPPLTNSSEAAERLAHTLALEKFNKESKKVLSYIVICCEPTWRTPLLQQNFTTAKAAYDWLRTENVTVLRHEAQRLRREMQQLHMLATEDVATYVERARTNYDTLMLMGDPIYKRENRDMVIQHILHGLPASWDTTVTLIQNAAAHAPPNTPPRSLLDLKGELIRTEAEDKQRKSKARPADPTLDHSAMASAFAALMQSQSPGTLTQAHPPARFCNHCQQSGHTDATCFFQQPGVTPEDARAAYMLERNQRGNQRGAQRASQHALRRTTHSANQAQIAPGELQQFREWQRLRAMGAPPQGPNPVTVEPKSTRWCVDSGVSGTMSPFRTGLYNYRTYSPPMRVVYAGGTIGDIVGFGTKIIRTARGGFTMQKVLHVPDLIGNLLSLADCWRQKIGIHFDPDDDIVRFVKDGTIVMTASFDNGLFYLDHEHHARAAAVIGATPPSDAFHWHRALGHVSFPLLARMKRENLLPATCTVTPEEFTQAGLMTCEPCLKGKSTRDSRPASQTPVPRPCYILHADLVVIPTEDLDGNKYALCVIDGYTSKSVAIPIKLKSDAKHLFPNIIALYERQSGHTVLNVRTDRGGEFMNEILGEFFSTKGIYHQYTAGYSSESNGKAERFNRTIMDKVRTMLTSSGLPVSYWGLAMIMANQLHNCIPVTTKTNKVSPNQALTGIAPNLSYLQPFGATAYVHIPKALRKKLDDHVEQGILVGYAEPAGSHTFIVRMPDGSTRTSRDVIFHSPRHTVHDAQPAAVNAPPVDAGPPALLVDTDSDSDSEHDPDDVPADAPPMQVTEPQAHGQPPGSAPPLLPPALAPIPDIPALQPPAPEQPARQLPPTQASERQPRERKQTDRYVAGAVRFAPSTGQPSHSRTQQRCIPELAGTPPAPHPPNPTPIPGLSVPTNYRDATRPDRADRDLWIEAMHSEYNSLVGVQAWELVSRAEVPASKHAIGCRWTYARKSDGRYKARLCAQGFSQRPGLDYDDTFAPTSKLSTLRTFLSIVASHDLECYQLDVTTAFLNARIDGEIYMRQPEGFTHNPNLLCRLLRALYGIKQAGRLWHHELRGKLLANGFTQSEADPSLYLLIKGGALQAAVLVYVDDCKYAGRTKEITRWVKELIMGLFKCVDLGESKLFLGIEISRDRAARTLTISQNAMVDNILGKYAGIFDVRPRKVPMQPTLKLSKDGEPMDAPQELYGSILGAIMYVANGTRPDIAYATHRLARYTQDPRQQHWEALLYLLGYLLRYPHVGITYGPEQSVRVYSDADHAGDWDTSRSTAGYAVIVNGGMTSWRSRIQASAAKSTCEAEYRASNATACEVLWYNKLLPELGQPLTQPININCDNQSAESLLKNPQSTEQSKYFRIFWHFGRDAQLRGELTFSYIKSSNNVADPFTKALPEAQLLRLMELGGVHVKSGTRPPK